MTVRERLTDGRLTFTRSEIKVIRELLSNYPVGGLTTVSGLARRAHVSDPTVVRLAHKLGFDGFADLQRTLLAEVEAHLNSPLTILAGRRGENAPDDRLQAFLRGMAASTQTAADEVVPAHFDAASSLLADTGKRVLCLGGRLSRHLAAILRWHLTQLRPGVELLTEQEIDLADCLVDIGPRDILVVYDFRRYQGNIVYFATQAQARGCKTILVTDRWQSPIADTAEIVFPVPVEAASVFDTMVPALALTEALIAAVARRSENQLADRLEAIEHIRVGYRAAFDGPAQQLAARAKKDRVMPPDWQNQGGSRPGKRARS